MEYICLKDIEINKIVNNMKFNYNKNLLIPSIKKLIDEDLKINIENMSVYKKNEQIEKFSYEKDIKEEKEIYKKETDKTAFLIKWYFARYINNQAFRFSTGADKIK